MDSRSLKGWTQVWFIFHTIPFFFFLLFLHHMGNAWGGEGKEKNMLHFEKKKEKKEKILGFWKEKPNHGLEIQKQRASVALGQKRHRRRGAGGKSQFRLKKVSYTMVQISTLYHRMHSHYTAWFWVARKASEQSLDLAFRGLVGPLQKIVDSSRDAGTAN